MHVVAKVRHGRRQIRARIPDNCAGGIIAGNPDEGLANNVLLSAYVEIDAVKFGLKLQVAELLTPRQLAGIVDKVEFLYTRIFIS